ncbi:hypothetical protein GGR53DRAFT_448381 [Hypoxylon sp. FL1150]|nr:hypothetical protein GGR53DRAFT_448381 [Hypoxylon sp. FL1150]
MMKVSITVGVFFVALLGQGSAQDTGLNACASGCVNGVFLNAPSMNCAMDDRVCVCNNTTDFTDGIRDCINQVCGSDAATQLPLAQSYGADQCTSASSAAGLLPAATPASGSASTTSPAVPTEQAPASTATTAAAETNATPSPNPGPTSSTVAASSAAVTAVAAASTTTAASSAASTSPESSVATSSLLSSSVSPASSSDSASTTTGDSDTPTGTSSAEESGDASPTPAVSQDSMTVAVRAGIGAGVGVAVVALATLAACLCMRRRKQKKAAAQGPTMQISEPLPGSGRQYADPMRQTEAGLSKAFVTTTTTNRDLRQTSSHQSEPPSPVTPSAASYSSELDANTRRYEDMQRGTQPRTMI